MNYELPDGLIEHMAAQFSKHNVSFDFQDKSDVKKMQENVQNAKKNEVKERKRESKSEKDDKEKAAKKKEAEKKKQAEKKAATSKAGSSKAGSSKPESSKAESSKKESGRKRSKHHKQNRNEKKPKQNSGIFGNFRDPPHTFAPSTHSAPKEFKKKKKS